VALGTVACGGQLEHSLAAERGPSPAAEEQQAGPDDVVVTVLRSQGVPVRDYAIRVARQTAKTNAQGQAVFRNVGAPYDLAVPDARTIYLTVSNRRPVFELGPFGAPGVRIEPATLEVDAVPRASTERYTLYSMPVPIGSTDLAYATDGSAQISLLGGARGTAHVASLLYAWGAGAMPSQFLGFAEAEFPASGSQHWSPSYGPIGQWSVTISEIKSGAAQTVSEAYQRVRWPGMTTWLPLTDGQLRGSPWTFTFPQMPNVETAVEFSAFDTGTPGSLGGAQIGALVPVAEGGEVPAVVLPDAPQLLAPADGASNVGAGTALEWTWSGEAVCQVSVQPGGGTPGLTLITLGRTATIPEPEVLGAGLPPLTTAFVAAGCTGPRDGSPVTEEDLLRGHVLGTWFRGATRAITVTTR
jgi:hypothetical protein